MSCLSPVCIAYYVPNASRLVRARNSVQLVELRLREGQSLALQESSDRRYTPSIPSCRRGQVEVLIRVTELYHIYIYNIKTLLKTNLLFP